MNLSIFYASCEFVSDRYKLISQLSSFTFEILFKRNRSESKLQLAIKNKDLKVVKLLVDRKHDYYDQIIELIDEIRRYRHIITETRKYDYISAMLLTKETLKHIDSNTFHCFCEFNFYECVKLLIENGCTLHHNDNLYFRTATESKNYRIVELFIINNKNLSLVSGVSDYYVMKLLIYHGIRYQIDIAFNMIISKQDVKTARLLLENGAKISFYNKKQILSTNNEEMIKLLQQYKDLVAKTDVFDILLDRLFSNVVIIK